jgi:peroxiredoxin
MARPILAPGVRAPEFTLPRSPDERVSLGDYRGRRVVLAFYPADWSPVCTDQMTLYNHLLEELAKYGTDLLGISVDGPWCHRAYARDRNIHFPLLSDFEPKGEVSRKYGAYTEVTGESARALFIIDERGTIAWSFLSPDAVNPGAAGILDALERMPRPAEAHVHA